MNLRKQLLINGLASGLLCSCAVWSPGADPRGRDLIARGNDLAAAIETFRTSMGRYPASLHELPGHFDLGRPGSDFHFVYEPESDSYRLHLNYTPSWPQSGLVSCFFQAGATNWGCHGYL